MLEITRLTVEHLTADCVTDCPAPHIAFAVRSDRNGAQLTDAELTASYPLGVSNEYAAGSDCITISTRSGALVVVETIAD